MKKKFIRSAAAILVLILALSFVFSGCSGKKEGEDGTTEMPSDAVEAIQTLKLPYSKADKLNPYEYAQSAAYDAHIRRAVRAR